MFLTFPVLYKDILHCGRGSVLYQCTLLVLSTLISAYRVDLVMRIKELSRGKKKLTSMCPVTAASRSVYNSCLML